MNLSTKPAFCSQNYNLNNKPAAFCTQNKFPIKFPKGLIIRCQSFSSDHGNGNMVDASMTILRQRIEEVRTKDHQERLKWSSPSSSTACFGQQKVINGWSYHYQPEGDKDQLLPRCRWRYWVEIVGVIGVPIGFVFLTGSLCFYLVSFIWSIFHL